MSKQGDRSERSRASASTGATTVEAGRAAGSSPRASIVEDIVEDARARQVARTSWDQHRDPTAVPLGYHVRGVSQLLDADGKPRLTWQKTAIDAGHQHQAMLDAFATMSDRITPTKLVAPPKAADDDLLAVYPMGDPHIGLHAWADETLDSHFDLKLATSQLESAVDKLVSLAPPASTAIVLPLGDFFHADNMQNRTSRSGHALDVDGRYAKIAAAGVGCLVRVVDRAAQRHRRVIVRCEIGNHDDQSAIWLALCLAQRYLNNPRIEINTSPAKFWYHRFGSCLIGSTHGDTAKHAGLGEIMAADEPEAWGATRHRYWYVGHIHTRTVHERPGCEVETFRTMAPRDVYATAAGYRSGRDMRLDILHSKHGRVNRHIVGIDQVMT